MELSAPVRSWFASAFEAPTPAQAQGWDAIARGQHTLILAPTGSGKTLAAFLWALDRLVSAPGEGCRVLYVSPLKALTYDVERNLRGPLAGIAREAQRQGLTVPDITIGARTGDTPADQRRALVRTPPDILVTTPESLYLLLTSRAASMLAGVEQVIVDEVHAVAGSKRGAHLALSLERLHHQVVSAGNPAPQRIGLSATQRPLEEVARWLGGQEAGVARPVAIVDAGVRKPLELSIVVPVEDMAELGRPSSDLGEDQLLMRGAAAGTPEVRASIWPAVYPRLLELVRTHRSTLIFVNSRRLAERLAARLNELAAEEPGFDAFTTGASSYLGAGAPAELVRAHHGSIAREQRLEIEDALKAGRLPGLVATSSLELGIDMGAIDLVVQVEAPTSVASGLQRIGRAGHSVGVASKGQIFPKFRHDLLVAAVVAERMHAGLIEQTKVPHNPLDVLAQQIVAMVAAAEGEVPVGQVAAVMRGAYPFAELGDASFESVLDMLSGRYPSEELAELRPRLVWDRVAGTLSARPGARMLAVTSGGTIPDRGLYGVFTPQGGRVGELDEEMVYESRVGETFLLGATTWRIEDITRDRVIVSPAPGVPGKMPFWHGDSQGRPYELGAAIGEFTRQAGAEGRWSGERLAAECGLDPLAVRNLQAYLEEERQATGGLLASDRQIVVEQFRDELGDWRVAVLSPFGARVHAPWALAIEGKVRERLGLEVQALWSDDGIILRLPDADDPLDTETLLLDPDEVEDLVVGAVGSSALFAARFRENAARSLLLPRRRPGSRTPLWQLRQRASDLLGVTAKHGDFPIVLETYRECLRDVFDLPALRTLMGDIAARRVRVATIELAAPSPFASGLVFAFVAQFMYEGDAPLAERRAQALTLDRRMLAELLGSDELRDLIDPAALASLEAELQALDERRWARNTEGAYDLLRRLGDLTPLELRARCAPGVDVEALLSARRVVSIRVAGEDRLVVAEDVARYRDALGAMPPRGLPEALLGPVPDALTQLVRRWARTHGPFLTAEPAARFGLDPAQVEPILRSLVEAGRVETGAFRPEGSDREWCDTEVLRLLRQRSLAALRAEVEPAEPEALARFLPEWHGVAPVGSEPSAAGLDRLWEVVGHLQGYALPASVLERDVLAARVKQYQGRMLDELLASGEIMWVGAGSLGRDDGRIVLVRREVAGLILPRLGITGQAGDDETNRPSGVIHDHLRQTLALRGACFFRELQVVGVSDLDLIEALWDLVWAGEVTGDGFAAVRATVGTARRTPKGADRRPRVGSLRAFGPPRGQGRWTLVARELEGLGDPSPTAASVALAGVLLERHGVLTREAVRGEGVPGGFAGIYPVLRAMEESGRCRRGYFVAGMGGAQFALPGAVDRLRAGRYGGSGPEARPAVVVLAATDPANPLGLSLPWPVRGPQRVAGAHVVVVNGAPALYVERGGKGLVALREFDGTWEGPAVAALGELVASGRWGRIALSRFPEGLEAVLHTSGFVTTPKGLVRYA